MVHGEVVGLKNGELVMGGILEGDCKDRSYLSKVVTFNLPHLHLMPPFGVTLFEFCRDLRRQKTTVLSYPVALFV